MSGSILNPPSAPEFTGERFLPSCNGEIAYEALVLEMARQPERLARCRERVRSNRDSSSLFDTAGYTRALESLLLAAWEALPGTRSDATTAGRALG